MRPLLKIVPGSTSGAPIALLAFATALLAFSGLLFAGAPQAAGQQLDTLPHFSLSDSELSIRQPAQADRPFTVTGPTGAILGLESGQVELWNLPTKVFRNLELEATIEGYSVPIHLIAAAIHVEPDHTTVTYSHAAITVRQHMFVPEGRSSPASGGMIFFEIDAIRPATITISLTPSMQQEWPAPQYGRPSARWLKMGSGGAYVLSTDDPRIFGMIGMPRADAGIMAPYQERPEDLPLEFKVHFDPKRDAGRYFPLVAEVSRGGEKNSAAAIAGMEERLAAKMQALPAAYTATRDYYQHYFDTRLMVHTPDARFDAALRWAEIAIDKSKVTEGNETGLTAGWYPSFDSARPGFGWFFGRDTLWTLYAVNSYGDTPLAKDALDFLARRQRSDGKIMHELSLTAGMLSGEMEWQSLGYEYAAADSTPLFILAMADYVRTTGDLDFLRSHWDQVKLAYRFERANDSDGDGVYDNSAGTGWVESWPPRMPHQEIYLALLDEQASKAISQMAALEGDEPLQKTAAAQAGAIAEKVAAYRTKSALYAFSKNSDGSYDSTATIFPAVGLWGADPVLPQPDPMLSAWASSAFSTDWGVRAVGDNESVYDPISYHQGSVWPLFTGWMAMAEYHAGKPLAGYAALMRNIDLTWAQDPGFVTEVLSGSFFQPLGRSSSQQLWSSAMIVAPAVRGLFGITVDAVRRDMRIEPKLPAQWDSAELQHVRLGDDLYDVTLKRQNGSLQATVASGHPTVLCLNRELRNDVSENQQPENQKTAALCSHPPARVHTLALPLPAVEIGPFGQPLPEAGSATGGPRVIAENYDPRRLRLTLEGPAGSVAELALRINAAGVHVRAEGGKIEPEEAPSEKIEGESPRGRGPGGKELRAGKVAVRFPPGKGFVTNELELSW